MLVEMYLLIPIPEGGKSDFLQFHYHLLRPLMDPQYQNFAFLHKEKSPFQIFTPLGRLKY